MTPEARERVQFFLCGVGFGMIVVMILICLLGGR